MFISAPSGPRRFALAWFAASTSAGLRVAFPSSRTVRVVSSTARPGLRTRATDARAIISPSLGHTVAVPHRGRRVDPVTFRIAVEHQREQLGSGRSVDRGVVDLGQDREAVVGQTFDHIGLPQWPVSIHRPADDPRRELRELLVGTGRWQRVVADVEVEVERRSPRSRTDGRARRARRASAAEAARGGGVVSRSGPATRCTGRSSDRPASRRSTRSRRGRTATPVSM